MTSLLQGVIRTGTAASVSALGTSGEIAGKTGTSNDGRDAWFVGYSSRLLAIVWVGFDDGQAHGLSGAQAALPIWADFMRQALGAYPAPAFTVPGGISFADIDATNGKLARSSCPLVTRETFLAGTEPERCDEHRGLSGSTSRVVAASSRLVPALISLRVRPSWIAVVALAATLGGCATARGPAGPRSAAPPGTVETGEASWYGERHQGRRTASGERYDMHRLTAAHPALPLWHEGPRDESSERPLRRGARERQGSHRRRPDHRPLVRGRAKTGRHRRRHDSCECPRGLYIAVKLCKYELNL